ncbi:MAG: hypothetical protein KDA58_11315 [Planctomycetaceae bacterium]|nr:hypothetical protein [Planctomycetaceae bacterium]
MANCKHATTRGLLMLFFTSVMGMSALAQGPDASPQDDPNQKPYHYGQYLVLTCHRVEKAGRYPVSYSQHEVTAINGKPLDKPFKAHVTYIESFDIRGNDEVVISGYFTVKEIGSPGWPSDSPEAEYMDVSMFPFQLIDWFTATGVREPAEARMRFEKEVVAKLRGNRGE